MKISIVDNFFHKKLFLINTLNSQSTSCSEFVFCCRQLIQSRQNFLLNWAPYTLSSRRIMVNDFPRLPALTYLSNFIYISTIFLRRRTGLFPFCTSSASSQRGSFENWSGFRFWEGSDISPLCLQTAYYASSVLWSNRSWKYSGRSFSINSNRKKGWGTSDSLRGAGKKRR